MLDSKLKYSFKIQMILTFYRFWHEIYGPMPDPRMEYACEIASATAYRTFDEVCLFFIIFF